MKNLQNKWLLLLLFIFEGICLQAQNLNGEKIKVSSESITALKFSATIMDYQWSNPSGYTCIARNNDNTLLIKTLNDNPAPTNLIVSEGKRTHYFIIDFLPKININETKLYYDYSDLKVLKKLVQGSGAAVAMNEVKENKPEEQELSAKEKQRIAKENEAKKLAAQEKRKQEEMERQRLIAEQKAQAEKLKQQEHAEAAKKNEEEEEKQRIANEKRKKDDEERERKEQEKLAAIKKEQEKIRAAQGKQQQIAAAKEADRKQKAADEATRIKRLNDEQEAAVAAAKEKHRLAEEKKKQQAEEKQRAKEEQERQRQLAALKEQQRKEEEKQKQLAKLVEEKRKREDAERARMEAEANKISYTHAELWKKYPNIVFGDPPPGQRLTGEYYIRVDTAENHRVSYRLLAIDHWLNIVSKADNGVTMVMQSLIFSGVNSYIRVTIKNDSDNDFLVGNMNLKWAKHDGGSHDLFPCYVTDFPVILPHKERTIVYASRAVNAHDQDKFIFSLTDRLNTTNLEFKFSGAAYNLEMSR